MFYDRKKDEARTDEVNSIFKQIAYLNKVSGQNEAGQNNTQVICPVMSG
jgi:ribonuclease PH